MEKLNFEVKFASDEAGVIEGYASLFGGEPDSYGDTIAKGAFAGSLAEHKAARTAPLMLWMHDPSEPIGVWHEVREDASGLAVKGRLILETVRGREAHALLKAGALNGLSIGFRVRDAERRQDGGRLLTEIDLVEISLVSMPAARRARVTSVKSAPAGTTAAKGAASSQRKSMSNQETAPGGEPGNTAVEDRVASLEETVSGIDTRLAAVEDAVGSVKSAAARIEAKLSRPGAATEIKSGEKVEVKAFGTFLRQGREALSADEVKSLRVADDTAGGYLAPAEFTAQMIKDLVEFSPVRQAAKVGPTSAGSVILPKRSTTPRARWVGETEDRQETGATYGQVEIQVHEAACYVDVSQRLLEDAAVNLEAEVASDLAEEFGRLEGDAFVNGDGAKKPQGFMSSADVGHELAGSTTEISPDALIKLAYAVPSFYRNRGTWMMNAATLSAIRQMKFESYAYIWQPSLQEGQPALLLGRPVVEAPDMPDIGSGKFPVVFGDFSSAYRIYDRVSLSVLRDPYSVATKGLVRFHARRRVGGSVVLPEAIRKLKMATS